MGIRDIARTWIINLIGGNGEQTERAKELEKLDDYYEGEHKKTMRTKPGKFDDNITINLCGLIVDKAVSALVGDPEDGRGVSWTFPSETGGETPESVAWLDEQWEAAKKEIFLHRNALIGAKSGFPAVKTVPDGRGNVRLINLDPVLLEVETDPQDKDKVVEYCIRYSLIEDDKEVQYKEESKPVLDEYGNPVSWVVELSKQAQGRRWELVSSTPWPYEFPPILAWQNLPVTDEPYGRADIEGIIEIQDRLNFTLSNLSKIVRLYAHPNRYGKNLSAQMADGEFNMGPDEMPMFNGDGDIVQLPPVGDLPAAVQFANGLREYMFLLAREVDNTSMKDKTGVLTNFALRVLYRDFLDKLGTKRMLYGAAYQELNRRLLVLGGYPPETCIINWPDPLPTNQQEETAALQADMNMGIVDKQTAAEIRGYDWEQVKERLDEQNAGEQNAGAVLLNSFFKTGGALNNQRNENVNANREVAKNSGNL